MSPPTSRIWGVDKKRVGYGTVESGKIESPDDAWTTHALSSFDEQWMSRISNKALLSSLTIPGTHDSAARTYGLPFIDTQSIDILQQLNVGIRYFDLRCGIRNDIVEMVHGPTLLGQTLQSVLNTLYAWLKSHPTEGVIIQIKKDREPENSSVHFSQAIIKHISLNSEFWRTANTTPSLGELRGKIQLFRRFAVPANTAYGIDVTQWQDNPSTPFTIRNGHQVQLTIQDHYNFTDPTPLPGVIAAKGGDVSGLLHRASDDLESGHWYLNFTSASEFNLSYQVTPKEIAVGGYRFFTWIAGLNPRLATFVKIREGKQRYGIIAMDFPDQGANDLIHALIMSNFKHKPTSKLWQRFTLAVVILLMLLLSFILGTSLACLQQRVDWNLHSQDTSSANILRAEYLNS